VIELQKRQSWRHSLCFVNISEHFWHPSGTKIMVAKVFVTISYKTIQESWGNSRESSDIVNRRCSRISLSMCCTRPSVTRGGCPWPLSLWTSVLPSRNFLHRSLTRVTHKVWSIHCTHSAMNFSGTGLQLAKNGSLCTCHIWQELL
jgi:hypothetical protein